MRGSGRYRIQAVAELTGVAAATLRAWERRYGIPSPERSSTAYRLYSDHDVALVRKMRRLTEDGVAPGEAARRLTAEVAPADEAPPPVDRDAFSIVLDRILDAVARFDPDALEAELRRALVLGSTVDVYERVMVPAMHRVGERWRDGALSVAHEHLTTEVLRNVAQDLHRLSQPEPPAGLAVVACFAEEDHVLPLYGIAYRLARRGLRTVLLGARTPPEAIAVAVDRLRPELVALSVTVAPDGRAADRLIAAYAAACADTPWAVGGGGAEPLRAPIEAAGGRVVGAEGLADLIAGRRSE